MSIIEEVPPEYLPAILAWRAVLENFGVGGAHARFTERSGVVFRAVNPPAWVADDDVDRYLCELQAALDVCSDFSVRFELAGYD